MLDLRNYDEMCCPDCGRPMGLRVQGGVLQEQDGVAHFAVPARQWWDNIGYT